MPIGFIYWDTEAYTLLSDPICTLVLRYLDRGTVEALEELDNDLLLMVISHPDFDLDDSEYYIVITTHIEDRGDRVNYVSALYRLTDTIFYLIREYTLEEARE